MVVNDKEIKVNIFDMAGHPVFYEVSKNQYVYDCLLLSFVSPIPFLAMDSMQNIFNSTAQQNMLK